MLPKNPRHLELIEGTLEQSRSERKTQKRVITVLSDELRIISKSCSKADSWAVDFFRSIFSKDLRKRVITDHR